MLTLSAVKIVAVFALIFSAFAATFVLVIAFFQNIKDDAEGILLQMEGEEMVNRRYIPKHVAECRKCGFCFLCDCIDHMHLIGQTNVDCSGCIAEQSDPANQATITVTQTVQ